MGVVIHMPERQPDAERRQVEPSECIVVIFPGVRIERGLPPDPATNAGTGSGARHRRHRRAT